MRDNGANGSSVTARQLGRHLDLTHQRIAQLVDENVIERLPNGRFDQDACRVAYLRWLRDPERRSARTQADAEFVRAKTALIEIRVQEKRRELIKYDDHANFVDTMMGLFLTGLSGFPPRIGGMDLSLRRRAEAIVFEMRTELAKAAQKLGDELGEPALGEEEETKS